MSDEPEIVSSLPPYPITEKTLTALSAHERVVDVVPLKMEEDEEADTVYVWDFAIEVSSGAYGLRFETEPGWFVVAEDEDVEAAGLAVQEYQEDHDL